MSNLTLRLRATGISLCEEAADALDGCARSALAYIGQADKDMERIAALEAQLAEARKVADGIHSYLDANWCQCGELPEGQECYWHKLFDFGKALSDAIDPPQPPNSEAKP